MFSFILYFLSLTDEAGQSRPQEALAPFEKETSLASVSHFLVAGSLKRKRGVGEHPEFSRLATDRASGPFVHPFCCTPTPRSRFRLPTFSQTGPILRYAVQRQETCDLQVATSS